MRRPMLSPLMRTALVAGPLLLLTAAPAVAQMDSREGIALRNDIYQLQQEIQQLQQQVARGGGGSSYSGNSYAPQSGGNDMVAQLLSRVDDLAEQVRQLRGRVEEAENKVQQQGADLSKRIDDLTFQVQNGGATALGQPNARQTQAPGTPPPPGTSPNSPPPAPLGATGAPPPPPPPPRAAAPRTPEAAIRDGDTALARHDYAAAEAAAREVLSKFRTSPRAYDAQYLLAEALAGQRRYPQAAIAYDDAYNRSRKGTHAPEALLGLASSLTAINEKKAACDTLVKLHTEFPKPRDDVRNAAAAVHQRAACR